MRLLSCASILGLTASLILTTASVAQDGSPIPGLSGALPAAGQTQLSGAISTPAAAPVVRMPLQPVQPAPTSYAPVPGANPSAMGGAPVPGQVAAARRGTTYGDLPMNPDDAKARIFELKAMSSTSRPQDLLERVSQLSEWLGDMVEAHNRMAAAFSKSPETKAQCLGEKQSAQRFAQLKRQTQLLRADLLIAMHRFPESLSPLVDIVIAEPTSATGKEAYKRLQQLGFSQEAADVPIADKTAPPSAKAAPESTSVPRKAAVSRRMGAPLPAVH